MATGGLSIPSLGGATGFAYRLADQFGLKIIPRSASLVPFTLTGKWQEFSQQLSGISVDVSVSAQSNKRSFRNALLFTHRGLSGPAILQISNYWELGDALSIDLLPDRSMQDLESEVLELKAQSPKTNIANALGNAFAKAFIKAFLELEFPELDPGALIGETPNAHLIEAIKRLKCWTVKPSGTEGYRTAEVTKGGVDVNDISSKTMQVKHQEGLYFIGEALDVTGHLGGYNFQWAWSSGYVAGKTIGAGA